MRSYTSDEIGRVLNALEYSSYPGQGCSYKEEDRLRDLLQSFRTFVERGDDPASIEGAVSNRIQAELGLPGNYTVVGFGSCSIQVGPPGFRCAGSIEGMERQNPWRG
jgi:hypothetical protein